MTDLSASPTYRRNRAVSAFTRSLHLGLGLGGMVLILATFLPLLHPFWPLASVAEHFALQILMGAAALGVLAVLLRRWRWLGLVAGIAFIQLWTIHPYWPSFVTGFVTGTRAAIASPTAGMNGGEMKVISLNVWVRGTSYDEVRHYLAASGADVIGLVEASPRWKAELAALDALYPYRVDCIDLEPGCQEILLSKRPFKRSGAARIDGRLPTLTWAEIVPDGNPAAPPIVVAVAHLARPIVADDGRLTAPQILDAGLPDLTQTEQADRLAFRLRDLGPDLVLLGDLNAAPWSRVQQALRQASGLDNQGFLAPSWPTFLPAAARLPIDHVLTRGTPRLIHFAAGPDVGSDHLPVEAIVALTAP